MLIKIPNLLTLTSTLLAFKNSFHTLGLRVKTFLLQSLFW